MKYHKRTILNKLRGATQTKNDTNWERVHNFLAPPPLDYVDLCDFGNIGNFFETPRPFDQTLTFEI